MLLGTVGAILLGNMLAEKGTLTTVYRYGNGMLRTGYKLKAKFLIPPHPLTNFEIQKYYQNEPRSNGVFSRDNLSNKIKDRVYVINLDEYADIGTYWIALCCRNIEVIYFESFAVENIPEEIKNSLEIKTEEN